MINLNILINKLIYKYIFFFVYDDGFKLLFSPLFQFLNWNPPMDSNYWNCLLVALSLPRLLDSFDVDQRTMPVKLGEFADDTHIKGITFMSHFKVVVFHVGHTSHVNHHHNPVITFLITCWNTTREL